MVTADSHENQCDHAPNKRLLSTGDDNRKKAGTMEPWQMLCEEEIFLTI